MRLRFAGWPHTEEYRSSALPGVIWRAGEERDVPDEIGAELVTAFGPVFVHVPEAAAVAPMVSGPPVDRMHRGPRGPHRRS